MKDMENYLTCPQCKEMGLDDLGASQYQCKSCGHEFEIEYRFAKAGAELNKYELEATEEEKYKDYLDSLSQDE
jgi:rubredoxin